MQQKNQDVGFSLTDNSPSTRWSRYSKSLRRIAAECGQEVLSVRENSKEIHRKSEKQIKIVGTTRTKTAKGTNSRHWVHDTEGIVGALSSTDYKQPKQIHVKNPRVHSLYPRSSKTGKGGTGHLTKQDGTSYCLDTGNNQAIEQGKLVRKFTPLETERLQNFPDNFTAEGIVDGKTSPVADTQRYKMMGNAVTTSVITAIIKEWFK